MLEEVCLEELGKRVPCHFVIVVRDDAKEASGDIGVVCFLNGVEKESFGEKIFHPVAFVFVVDIEFPVQRLWDEADHCNAAEVVL